MNLKEFFKITPTKVILLIVLLILTIFIPKYDEQCNIFPDSELRCKTVVAKGIGYPIFYGERYYNDAIATGFYPLMFVLNLIVLYLISCVIISIIKRK